MLHNPATGQDNAMSLLSTFLLQGWVMTDEKCPVPDCYVPIMRSKDGSVRFCVTHDPLPTSSPNAKGASVQPTTRSTEKEINQYTDAAAAAVKSELKDNKDDDAALLRKRREQSSRASQIIGQKLLQRWTLLNEVCPNPECYAIPLMRDPSKRMICVNCNRSYITEEEAKTDRQTSKQEPVKNEVEKATAERFEDQSHRKKQKTLEDEKSAAKAIQRKASVDIGKLHAQRVPSSSTVLDAIDTKLQDLINQLQDVSDPSRLKLIFEAIEAAARAKKACAEADKAFS